MDALQWVAAVTVAAFALAMVVVSGVLVVSAVEQMIDVCKGWGGDGE